MGGSLAVVMVLTSSTAELKSLIFSEEYSPDGLLYWLVTTLEPKPVKGRALLLWVEPMCFTSCKNQAAKVRRVQYLWNPSVIETSNTLSAHLMSYKSFFFLNCACTNMQCLLSGLEILLKVWKWLAYCVLSFTFNNIFRENRLGNFERFCLFKAASSLIQSHT